VNLFVDSEKLSEIETALGNGFIEGVTTNPSLLAKEPKADYLAHLRQIVSLIRKSGRLVHLSVEVIAQKPQDMARQAESFAQDLAYEQLAIQVPISQHCRSFTLVVREFTRRGNRGELHRLYDPHAGTRRGGGRGALCQPLLQPNP
jgi:transaldolase